MECVIVYMFVALIGTDTVRCVSLSTCCSNLLEALTQH